MVKNNIGLLLIYFTAEVLPLW